MEATEFLVGAVVLLGLVGIVLPLLPGSLLILAAVLAWAAADGSGTAWAVFTAAAVLLAVGAVVKYAVPGRGLRTAGVPRRSLLAGVVLGLLGFFVVPVVGLLLGFVLGVYLSERVRLGGERAWPSTKAALRAVGLSILVELAAGLLASCAWVVGALVT